MTSICCIILRSGQSSPVPAKQGAALLNPNYTVFTVLLEERLQVALYRKKRFILSFQIPYSILSAGKLSRHSPYPLQLLLVLI